MSESAARRFLIHVLLGGFHRIRHYGLFANCGHVENIARARPLLNAAATHVEPSDTDSADDSEPQALSHPCPCCGGRMIVIEAFERGCAALSVNRPEPDGQLMIVIAGRNTNAVQLCLSPSPGHDLARPMTSVVPHLTQSRYGRTTIPRPNAPADIRDLGILG